MNVGEQDISNTE